MPGLLFGAAGLVLAVAMQWVGLYSRANTRLESWLLESVFRGELPAIVSLPVLILVTAVCCFGLAYAVLDSPGGWRRLILGITVLVLLFAMVPTLAVWHIYFPPFLPVVGVFWTWFCTMMYVNHHVMPCDMANSKPETQHPKPTAPDKTQTMVEKKETDAQHEKYKPKENLDG